MNDHRFEVRWATQEALPNDALDALAADAEHDHEWTVSRHPQGLTIAAWMPADVYWLSSFATDVTLFLDKHDVPGEVAAARVITEEAFEAEALTPDTPELLAATDVADTLGVSRQRVHQLATERADFPTPYVRLGSGPIWTRPAIDSFNRSWTRKPGRPARTAS